MIKFAVMTSISALALLGGFGAPAHSADVGAPADRPWMNRNLSPEKRAELLADQLTREEQLSLAHGLFPLFVKDRPPGMLQSAGYVPGVPRLGVPPLIETDASLGVAAAGRKNDVATPLPSGLAVAASFDPEVAFAGGAMIGKEARQKGFNIMLAGGVNLVRDPRNGRNFEYVGEDPLLAGTIGGQSIKGVQSNHIVSTAKHFVLNGQETGRMVLNATIDPAALRESDLLAFEIAVETGRPGSVMCAYNKINGAYACENPYTLGALKADWGWRGWVMSDWGAVHSTVPSAMAGLDQESGEQLDRQVYFGAPLEKAVADGQVPAGRLKDMARRVLFGLFSTGAMDDPVVAGALDTTGDAAVAERAEEAGLVLLKNDHDLLPLAKGAKRIAVIGGHADVGVLSGGGSSQVIPPGAVAFPAPKGAPAWGGGEIYDPSSPLAALKARAAGGEISFSSGADIAAAVSAAKSADVAVVFATQWSTEAMDLQLSLPDGQDALIAAVAAANPHTIVVLETGGPVTMPWLDRVGAVVEAWYPGAKGGEAIAKLLYGDIDAQGRLPVTFPKSEAQLPRPVLPGAQSAAPESLSPDHGAGFDVPYPEGADVGYRWFEKQGLTPLFSFGHGLSYTRFHYSGLKLTGGGTLKASFTVTNIGARAGVDTPQVYASAPKGTRHLIGWKKLALKPGEIRRVEIVADPRLLAVFNTAQPGWSLADGDYQVSVGYEAGQAQLSGRTHLGPKMLKP